ncbi:unnamed protein product [Paramecium pentaurelia]|uniref:Uncharacterized protein n=1 Tax=Paramecium pentaurelia TaxID=43138 RepID=A0A8S1TTF9_9CILI|nr:unnamed protein product [Paramecium pentaurelia]
MRNQSNLLNNSIILADIIYYLQDQATYYTAIYTGLKTLFSNQYSNEIFEKNIIILLLNQLTSSQNLKEYDQYQLDKYQFFLILNIRFVNYQKWV